MKYVIITPVQNEEAYIRFTLDSVVSQTVLPDQWIIVDDGSTDDTTKIIQEYVNRYSWINLVALPVGGGRELGARVVRAFYEGYTQIKADFDFIVKLDGDLSFEPDFFDLLLKKFAEDSYLGIAGGKLYIPDRKQWRLERSPVDHVRGATKVYRKTCFDEIGGLPVVNGWDGIDELRAQMKGWKTCSYSDVIVHHLRPTGAYYSLWRGNKKEGEDAFFLGYPLLVILARSLYRAFSERPLFIMGIGIFVGYVQSWLARKPQFSDVEVMTFLRHKEFQRMRFFWRSESR